jgi:uncharacterized sulfatase
MKMEFPVRTRREFLKAAGLCASSVVFSGCGDLTAPPTARPLPEPAPEKPNILWITCEDISPYLGCYGDPFAITPNLDRLAGQSIVYDNAYVTAPVCAPVRSCLITGVYATSLGTQHLRSEIKLPSFIQPFPKLMRAAGYYCTNNYKEDYNFTDNTIWDESSQTAHWRNRAIGQPFFSVFNLMSTHQGKINGPDEEFNAKWRSKLAPEELHDADALVLPPYYPDTPMVRKIWARYYDLITYMDEEVRELLDALEADALTDNTIVFFFSDHGMGLPRFKRTLYDSGLRIPLMVRVPGRWQHLVSPAPGGRTDRLVSTIDIPPTVLQLAGVTVPDHMQGRAFLGPQPAPPREYIFGAASRVDEVYEVSRCVRDRRYKYIRNFMPHLSYIQPSEYPDRAEIMQELRGIAERGELIGPQKPLWEPSKPVEELYDTQADPHEIENRCPGPFAIATATVDVRDARHGAAARSGDAHPRRRRNDLRNGPERAGVSAGAHPGRGRAGGPVDGAGADGLPQRLRQRRALLGGRRTQGAGRRGGPGQGRAGPGAGGLQPERALHGRRRAVPTG